MKHTPKKNAAAPRTRLAKAATKRPAKRPRTAPSKPERVPPSYNPTFPLGSDEASDDEVTWGRFKGVDLSNIEDAFTKCDDEIKFYFNELTEDEADEVERSHELFFALFKETHPRDDATLDSDRNATLPLDEEEESEETYSLDIVFRGSSLGQLRSFLVGMNYGVQYGRKYPKQKGSPMG